MPDWFEISLNANIKIWLSEMRFVRGLRGALTLRASFDPKQISCKKVIIHDVLMYDSFGELSFYVYEFNSCSTIRVFNFIYKDNSKP